MLHPSRQGLPSNRRRGVILLVVLTLITLLTLMGISFVIYAEGSATGSRIYREAQGLSTESRGSEVTVSDAALAWDSFLGQVIYDVNDDTFGTASALRGH